MYINNRSAVDISTSTFIPLNKRVENKSDKNTKRENNHFRHETETESGTDSSEETTLVKAPVGEKRLLDIRV